MERFTKNKEIIDEVNAEAEGKDEYALRLAINPLIDMMPEELPFGLTPDQNDIREGRRQLDDEDIPYRLLAHKAVTVDHHIDGHLVPVKNQRSCGSCWAFAANSALEAAIAIKYKTKPVHLSEQYLVDCLYSDSGCNGGWMNTAWTYMARNGVILEDDYPYTGTYGNCKRANTAKKQGVVGSFRRLTSL